jgi:hypothetical protein
MQSIFTNKANVPNDANLQSALGETYDLWQIIADYVHSKHSAAFDEWNYMGGGWNFRVKDKKRVVIYLLPRDGFFKVALVFGQKATDMIMQSEVSEYIKTELEAAKVYVEGRGIRIEVKNHETVNDIKVLIDIKLAN